MKTKTFFAGLSLSLMTWLSGCVVLSLTPFCDKQAEIELPAINGEWQMLEDNGSPKKQKPWVFKDGAVETFDDKGGTGSLKAVYFKIGDNVFLDSYPDNADDSFTSGWWRMHLAPCHTVSKLALEGDRLVVTPLKADWLKKMIKEGKVSLPLAQDGKGEIAVYAATPAQWMDLLKRYGTDAGAFPTDAKFVFSRMKK